MILLESPKIIIHVVALTLALYLFDVCVIPYSGKFSNVKFLNNR